MGHDHRPRVIDDKVPSHLVDVLQQARGDVGEVSVHSPILRVLQQASEPHHPGVGGAQAQTPVNLPLWIQQHLEAARRLLQPQLGALHAAERNHEDLHRPSLEERLIGLQLGHVVPSW